ncbi:MAG: FIST N-terminal domain-containing protein [Rhodocyclaceae bacterium]|nr:FIST N-terminal domain-containing protein [Rhodocyclaceae bacterium]
MEVQQKMFKSGASLVPDNGTAPLSGPADLVLVFGSCARLAATPFASLRALYPAALIVGCSTAGEIFDTVVADDSLTLTAVHFARTRVGLAQTRVGDPGESRAAGQALARQLAQAGLCHVLVFSDGLHVNGTELVDGLRGELPAQVAVTGGLSGDGADFKRTLVIADAPAAEQVIAAVGFYGDALRVGYGSLGGWDPFGPDRLITRASGNVLYELDGQSALELYKRYLGEHAAGLPATGLLFPLELREQAGSKAPGLVRTILSVNEDEQSMTFAGDMPEGVYARLMKANFDRLIDGASGAALATRTALGTAPAELAILISCVGRKLVLQQRVEEEVESVRDVLGPGATLTGFYSYGEISPSVAAGKCELHNQTMTITTFAEV